MNLHVVNKLANGIPVSLTNETKYDACKVGIQKSNDEHSLNQYANSNLVTHGKLIDLFSPLSFERYQLMASAGDIIKSMHTTIVISLHKYS